MPEIFADVYLITNLMLNYALLYATAVAAAKETTVLKLIQAAGLGAIYSLGYLLFSGTVLFSLPAVALVAVAMVSIAFRPLDVPEDLVVLFPFSGLVLAGGGTGLVMLQYISAPGQLYVPYVRARIGYPLVVGAAIVLMGWAVNHYWNRRVYSSRLLVHLQLWMNGSSASCRALVDTGNRLVDPITGDPVIVIEHEAIRDILPDGCMQFLHGGRRPEDDAQLGEAGFRLVPFESVDRGRGVMPGFRPDRISLGGHGVGRAVVCVTSQRLSSGGQYQALVPPRVGHKGRGADLDGRIS